MRHPPETITPQPPGSPPGSTPGSKRTTLPLELETLCDRPTVRVDIQAQVGLVNGCFAYLHRCDDARGDVYQLVRVLKFGKVWCWCERVKDARLIRDVSPRDLYIPLPGSNA